ncbi:MAG TPA: DUF2914 domain-containing protein [Rhizomicrobium sp.]|jgi:uncharacterized membrane protein YfbV (UPF0208 family)|nr:DUF2914 domain-containing protein [Rhizomicrobium sp.]
MDTGEKTAPRKSFWRRAKKAATADARVEPGFEASAPAELTAEQKRAASVGTAASHAFTLAGAWSSAQVLRKTAFGWVTKHERALSGASMVGGYGFDSYNFRRIDLPNTQLLFLAYLALAAVAILMSHAMIARARRKETPLPRWHGILPMATQFALGGLWSAFFVFYSRGAVFSQSWPFLLVLAGIFIGNEVFKHYHSRLAFSAILFFFAIFSYAVVTAPIFTRSIGTLTFLVSGAVALGVFWLFVRMLASLGRTQWKESRWWVALGVAGVYATLNFFYFINVLPPLPLALADSGVYHSITRDGKDFRAAEEPQTWLTAFGAAPILHVTPNQPLYVYGAVFAPIHFSMNVIHRWQHYDPATGKWRTVQKITFPMNGGRDGGYRASTLLHHVAPGDWRVDVDTAGGHIIGRVRFTVEAAASPVATEDKILK